MKPLTPTDPSIQHKDITGDKIATVNSDAIEDCVGRSIQRDGSDGGGRKLERGFQFEWGTRCEQLQITRAAKGTTVKTPTGKNISIYIKREDEVEVLHQCIVKYPVKFLKIYIYIKREDEVEVLTK